tara:strand:+ start:1086 stop:1592 length:507 start_codon:yes stop_codon:yes gene_type:complete
MRTKNLIRNILIGISALLLISCEDTYYEKEPFISFDWDVRLPIDENGYYHLEMDRNNFQTLHRISGNVGEENVMVNWESDLYWVLGDTLGYIVKSGYTDDLVYVAYDTVYVTGFEGELVRTTNWTSYSNSKGEINNMIAPVKTMIGDTLNVGAYYNYELVEVFSIVLD